MKLKQILITLVVLVAVMIFCLVVITTRIFAIDDLPLNFVGAFMGALVTSAITTVLLTGQTSAQEVKERNVKVFEKKSRIFEKYIEYIWEVLKDKRLEIVELEKLIDEYNTKLMIYLNEKSTRKMDEFLSNLADCITKYNDDPHLLQMVLKKVKHNQTETVSDKLKKNLFGMINLLSNELGLGGKIDLISQSNLEKKMLPQLFRQRLITAIENSMRDELVLEGGNLGNFDIDCFLYTYDKFEFYFLNDDNDDNDETKPANVFRMEDEKDRFIEKIKTFAKNNNSDYFNYDYDYISFRLKFIGAYEFAFLLISLSSLKMKLFIDIPHKEVDRFRYYEEIETEENEKTENLKTSWIAFFKNYEYEDGIKLGEKLPQDSELEILSKRARNMPIDGINFFNSDSIEEYRDNYQEITDILAKRFSYWFKKKLIKDGEELLTITEFIKKYYRTSDEELPLCEELASYLIEEMQYKRIKKDGVYKEITDSVTLCYEFRTNCLCFNITDLNEEQINKIKIIYTKKEFEDNFTEGIYDNSWDGYRSIGKILISPFDFPGGIEIMKPFVGEKCRLLEQLVKQSEITG